MDTFTEVRLARGVVDADAELIECCNTYCVHCDCEYPDHDDCCIVVEAIQIVERFENGST